MKLEKMPTDAKRKKAVPVKACECFYIEPHGPLDGIHVFFLDIAPGQGSVTIVCWGQAWSCYFGGMCRLKIRQFFCVSDTEYLVNKLGITPLLKQSKKNATYLSRIIDAVKDAL